MEITQIKDGVDILVVDGMYTQEELTVIDAELKFLTSPHRMLDPYKTDSALDERGIPKKKNMGILLDYFYTDRNSSDILRTNRKLFSNEIMSAFFDIHPAYTLIRNADVDVTLINYYENSDYYKPHKDLSAFTALTWFFQEPRAFTGGEFVFTKYGLKIEVKNNRMVMFPSSYVHEVLPVQMVGEYKSFGGQGRYSMSQFLYIQGNSTK